MSRLRMAAARTATLTLSGSPTLTATQNSAYAGFTPSTTGGSGGNTFSMVGTALPAGMSHNTSTGAVTGTPTGSGTVSGIIQRVADSFGHTADLSWGDLVVSAASYNDGLSGAPSGSANYPTYLDNNSGTNALGVAVPNRPSWNVAGVDYRVGPPTGQTFKVLGVDTLPTGCSYTPWNGSSGGYVRADSLSAMVLDGWDLGSNGVYVPGLIGDLTIKNCKYKAVSGRGDGAAFVSYPPGIQNGKLTVQNNEIDGDYISAGNLLEQIKGPDNDTLIEYNLFKNMAADAINSYNLYGSTSCIVRYNTMVNGGADWLLHCDFFQILNPASGGGTQIGHWYGIEVYGNTVVMQSANGSNIPSSMNAVGRLGDMDGKNVYNPKFHHNTILSIGTNHTFNNSGTQAYNGCGFGTVWQWNSVGPTEGDGNYIKNLECHDNYFFSDDSGRNATDRCINGYFYQGASPGISYTMSNNVKMWDGTTFPNTLP